jgi:hypothetical protein
MKCLDDIQKTWPRDGILRVQISQNSSIHVINGDTIYDDEHEGYVVENETLLNDNLLNENMSSNLTNQSKLDMLDSIPEDKPSLNFKPKRETLLHVHDSIFDGK